MARWLVYSQQSLNEDLQSRFYYSLLQLCISICSRYERIEPRRTQDDRQQKDLFSIYLEEEDYTIEC